MALGQPLVVRDVQIQLAPPRLVLLGLTLGPPDAPLLRVGACEVVPGRIRVADREVVVSHLRLKGVRLSGGIPETNGQAGEEPWVRLVVRQLELVDVQVDDFSLPSDLRVSISDFDLRWTGSWREPVMAAVIHAPRFSLAVPGLDPIEGGMSAWGRRTTTGWELRRLRGNGPGWSVVGSGELSRAGAVRARGDVQLDAATLDRVVGAGADLEGDVSAAVTVEATRRGFRLDAAVRAARIGVAGFELSEVEGEAHVSPEGVEASLARAVIAGGDVSASYTLEQLGPPWRHRIAARGTRVALAGFLRQIGVPDAGLAGRCGINAELTWSGQRIGEGAGTALIEVREDAGEVPVAGRVVLALPSRGALEISSDRLRIAGADVQWSGSLSLKGWVPSWSVKGEGFSVPVVAGLLAGWVGSPVLPPELGGEAALDVALRGPFDSLKVVGMAAIAPASFGPIEADGVEASFTVAGGVLTVEDASVVVGTGRVKASGELHFADGERLRLALDGRRLPLARLLGWTGVQVPVEGTVELRGVAGGTLARPNAGAGLRFSDVRVAGVPFGDGQADVKIAEGIVVVRDLAVGPFTAALEMDLGRRQAAVEANLKGFALESISPPLARLVGGALDCRLRGAFPLDRPAGSLLLATANGGRGVIELDPRGLKVSLARPDAWSVEGALAPSGDGFAGRFSFGLRSLRIVAEEVAGFPLPIDGELAGGAEVELEVGQPPRISGAIERLNLVIEGERAALEAPARFTLEGGAVRLAGARLVGPRSSLDLSGGRESDGRLYGSLRGELPAALLSLLWPEARPRGRLEVAGELLGSDRAPRLEGRVQVSGGSLVLAGLPGPLTDIEGLFELVPESIHVAGVRFAFGGGRGVCEGQVALSPVIALDLDLQVEGARWPLSPGFSPVMLADLRLSGPLDSLSLFGEAVLQRSVYREELNLQKLIMQQLRAPERVASGEGAGLRLDLNVQVPGTLEVNTPLARLATEGELRIVGTTERTGVLGRLEVLPGGEFELSGVRYEVSRATVTFANAEQIEPFLDLSARTSVQNVEISVSLIGTLDRMRPTFASNPPLPEMDIVALLSLGRRADEAGQVEAGTVASSLLTEELTGVVTRRARTLLDVDQLRVDPFASTTTGNPAARLTVVKQISPDWTVAVATNIASNREELVTSRWRLASGMFLVATRDSDGSYSLELKWQQRY